MGHSDELADHGAAVFRYRAGKPNTLRITVSNAFQDKTAALVRIGRISCGGEPKQLNQRLVRCAARQQDFLQRQFGRGVAFQHLLEKCSLAAIG